MKIDEIANSIDLDEAVDIEPHHLDLLIFNQVFQRKTLVIRMMNIGGRAVGGRSIIRSRSITLQRFEILE